MSVHLRCALVWSSPASAFRVSQPGRFLRTPDLPSSASWVVQRQTLALQHSSLCFLLVFNAPILLAVLLPEHPAP